MLEAEKEKGLQQYLYVENKVKGMPVSIGIYMDKKSTYAGIYGMLYQIVLVVLCSIFVIMLVSYYMSRILVRRIELLTDSVNQIEMGNMVLNLEDDSQDEIGVLIRSFRKMFDQIQALIREVYQSKIARQRLEMQALQAQINPHFLYNTLSLINWKAIGAGEEDISRITLALSDFYRTTLSRGRSFITVESEILNIHSYLEIQLMMHDYEFEVEYDIDPAVNGCYMPKLILQPLVENALEHGLDLKEEGEKKLTISCRGEKETLVFVVRDTGVGMDETTLTRLVKTHTTGYGVNNVNDRLVLLYGDRHRLYIESRPGTGTNVWIRIPRSDKMPEETEDGEKMEAGNNNMV
ncbi:MAG: sensor histidine kinase [Lachnospiraceae bacterium]|nr:sensor histidine kinase [Lachnospiraceae bacterium]